MGAGGPLRRARARERRAAREPARRPARPAAVGLHAARLRRRAGRAPAVDLRHPGPHRAPHGVAERLAVAEELPPALRRGLRDRRGPARCRRLRRRLDEARREPVRGLPGDGPLPHVPLRRGRPLRRRALPDAPRGRAPRDHGQVERRLRGDDHADAPPRPLGRPRDARGRRSSSSATCPTSGAPSAPSATTTTGRSSASGRTSARARRSRRTAISRS